MQHPLELHNVNFQFHRFKNCYRSSGKIMGFSFSIEIRKSLRF
ncbi:hypothetical protein LBBP_02442 [Leptospira borgpetersenii serovar Ballum]|uniref:Uncharacterized protein n=1 Tax=Leptospira borgpetersenii serovar Ballum TaxID=280505 RepID=A0A0S2ISQ2_LEPBO|nr:hypothetical protein LBBP_02442 [Leptospira borgpetersenii serovar Ballum]